MTLFDGRGSAEVSIERPRFDAIGHVDLDRVAEGRRASLAVRRERARLRRDALLPIIAELREVGATSYQAIADGLNGRGVPAPRGERWKRSQARHILRSPR